MHLELDLNLNWIEFDSNSSIVFNSITLIGIGIELNSNLIKFNSTIELSFN
jgi:hypothetical protein